MQVTLLFKTAGWKYICGHYPAGSKRRPMLLGNNCFPSYPSVYSSNQGLLIMFGFYGAIVNLTCVFRCPTSDTAPNQDMNPILLDCNIWMMRIYRVIRSRPVVLAPVRPQTLAVILSKNVRRLQCFIVQ